MYCPKCFNNTLKICSKGVIQIVINGKQMDAGRFLFNINDKDKNNEFLINLTTKIREFFDWYSQFQNKEPITIVELSTSDVQCVDGCAIAHTIKTSIIGQLISTKQVLKILREESSKYELTIQLED